MKAVNRESTEKGQQYAICRTVKESSQGVDLYQGRAGAMFVFCQDGEVVHLGT